MIHPAQVVYMLCTLTAFACAVLLSRAYGRSRAKILFWSALCFYLLALNNAILFVDLVVVPGSDLRPIRDIAGLSAMAVLAIGLIWNAD
jgi:hypothetical protein